MFRKIILLALLFGSLAVQATLVHTDTVHTAGLKACLDGQTTYGNLAFTYAAGTFAVKSADGTDLSASNPGCIGFQNSTTPGQNVIKRITANKDFIDDAGASEIINNRFGNTTGVAWANDKPYFVYGCLDTPASSGVVELFLTDNPAMVVLPLEGSIGAPNDPVADFNGTAFSFDNLIEADYAGKPCTPLGAIRMQMSASDDHTVQALSTKDGVGHFHENTEFTMPKNQRGADLVLDTHYNDNGGAAPVFTTQDYFYKISRSGEVTVQINQDNVSTAGTGAVAAHLSLPYDFAFSGTAPAQSQMNVKGNLQASAVTNGNNRAYWPYLTTNTTPAFMSLRFDGGGGLQNNLLTLSTHYIIGTFSYQAFKE